MVGKVHQPARTTTLPFTESSVDWSIFTSAIVAYVYRTDSYEVMQVSQREFGE